MTIKKHAPGIDRTISSTHNQKIKHIVRLRHRSSRDNEGMMIVEGCLELNMALDNGIHPVAVFYSQDFYAHTKGSDTINRCREQGIEIFKCDPGVFSKIAYGHRRQGVLAIVPQPKRKLSQITLSRHPLLLVAQSIEKPGNLGTILRSADAAGADAVIVCDRCTDIYNPNVVRASIGTIFSVPVIETSSEKAIAWLRQHDVKIIAASPHSEMQYTGADMLSGTAIAVGEEHHGLNKLWITEADFKVRIPMKGRADSLNVASAATILLFEAARQRI